MKISFWLRRHKRESGKKTAREISGSGLSIIQVGGNCRRRENDEDRLAASASNNSFVFFMSHCPSNLWTANGEKSDRPGHSVVPSPLSHIWPNHMGTKRIHIDVAKRRRKSKTDLRTCSVIGNINLVTDLILTKSCGGSSSSTDGTMCVLDNIVCTSRVRKMWRKSKFTTATATATANRLSRRNLP